MVSIAQLPTNESVLRHRDMILRDLGAMSEPGTLLASLEARRAFELSLIHI